MTDIKTKKTNNKIKISLEKIEINKKQMFYSEWNVEAWVNLVKNHFNKNLFKYNKEGAEAIKDLLSDIKIYAASEWKDTRIK